MKIKINVVDDVKESSVKDNDLTEYRNSIKPDYVKRPYFFKETHIIGNPVHVGDVLLIKVKDKLFKCEIVDKKIFDKAPNLFSANFYPLDEDNKAAFENTRYRRFTKKNYLFGAIKFDKEIKDENGDTYWEFDFTKGVMNLFPIINGFEEFSGQPFTVVKFLTKSIPGSAVQDSYSDLTDISQGLNEFVGKCLEFKHLVEYYYKNNLERNIKEEEKKEDELDGYTANPVYSLTKNHLEWVTSTTDDLIYCIQGLIDDLKKGE